MAREQERTYDYAETLRTIIEDFDDAHDTGGFSDEGFKKAWELLCENISDSKGRCYRVKNWLAYDYRKDETDMQWYLTTTRQETFKAHNGSVPDLIHVRGYK